MIIRYFDLPETILFTPDIRVAYGMGEFTDYIRLGKNPLVVTVNKHRKGYLFSDHTYKDIKKVLKDNIKAAEALSDKGLDWLNTNITIDSIVSVRETGSGYFDPHAIAKALHFFSDIFTEIVQDPTVLWQYQDTWESFEYDNKYYDLNIDLQEESNNEWAYILNFTLYSTCKDDEGYVACCPDNYIHIAQFEVAINAQPLYKPKKGDTISK